MTVHAIINDLHAKGIELRQEDGQLKLKAPKGALTDDIREQLISNKSDIIAFLQGISATKRAQPISPASRAEANGRAIESFPLSYAQERLWFIDQLEPGSAGYNIPAAVIISGELNADHLDQAFNLIIARHENLRTIFPSKEGQAQQVILDHVDFKLNRIDLSHHKSNQTRHEKARQLCETEAATPFDLAKGPLIRGKLIKLTEQEHILMLTMHHIISDGWSTGVMIRELGVIMNCLQQGLNPSLPPLPIQYLDYSVWQRNLLEEEGLLEQQLDYWQEKLAGVPESLNLATDYPRPSVQSFAGARQAFRLDAELAGQINSLAEQQGCTLFMTLLAAFKVLLYRYSGEEDICLGSPIANRQYGETESLIGMFVNTLALRSQLEGDAPFTSFLADVKATCLEAYDNQDTPFEKIVDLVQPGRSMAISPLFQIMFVLQNAPEESTEQRIQPYPLDSDISKFDLTISCAETQERLEGTIEYNTSLYSPQTIERLAQHFEALCQAIVNTPTAHISALEFIGEAEKQQLLTDFNNTQADHQKDKCIHQLFIEQVAINPDKTAVVYQDQTLSYQQLYDKSHELAIYLQSLGVKPDSMVGLCVERSLEMTVGILGILQAGGAYVPLDPDYPDDRLAYMLEDTQSTIVLSQEKFKNKLSDLVGQDTQIIALDHQWSEISHCVADLEAKKVKLQKEVKAHHLAYVIYTSGSTGQPKGVEVVHSGVVAFLSNPTYLDVTTVNKVASFSSFAFDGFVFDLFLSLSIGSSLYLYKSDDYLQPVQFQKNIQRDEVDTFFVTTALFNQFVENNSLQNSSVKQILFGGEKCNLGYVEKLKEHYPDIRLMHVYGPTEAIVYASSCELNKQIRTAPIGKAINNNQLLVLNERLLLTPIGAIGELYIGGDSLARGYLNHPELTAERFVANPYHDSSKPGSSARLYRTGDLVRTLPDGNVDFIGRADGQVKIRGFRIEFGEIEARLNQNPKIQSSVVIVHDQEGNKNLIAYYVAEGTQEDHIIDLDHEALRAGLQQTLPEYMLPATFVSLEAIPLTPNGKVDRRALERMDVSLESSQAYLAPRNEMEKQLVVLWAEVLNLEPEAIGVNDNFFELGGHSLLATQLISRVRSQFAIELPLKALFEHATISGFAAAVVKADTSNIPPIVPVKRTDEEGQLIDSFPLSYAQERLWFIDQLEPNSAGYNIPAAVTISGEINVDHLDQAFNLIVARHENLRTIFPSKEGRAQQVILDHLDFKLERIDLGHYKSNKTRHKKARQLCQTEATTPFDLAKGPLIRGKLIKLTDQEHVLMLTMHHIISDGWSIGVMIEEFGVIMDCLRQDQNPGKSPDLPVLPIQYLDYSVWQRNLLEAGGLLEQQLGYWQEKLAGVPESLNLVTDYPRPSVQNFAGAKQAFGLDAGLADQLRGLAEQQGCTLFMTLLAAFKVLLYRYSGEKDICLGSPIANRQYGETESLIGMFVNTLALRSQLEGDASFISLLTQVKTTCLEAYEHQDTPFEKIVDLVQPGRSMSISPLFQIMFNLQNAPEESTEQSIQSYPLDSDISKFDLTFACAETLEGVEGVITYRTALFKPETIERMAQHFKSLCRAIVTTPTAHISALEFIGEAEKQKLLVDYNKTQADYPKDICIHQLFIEQVLINPDKTAVVYQDQALSYQQFYDKSHELALYLQSLGVKPDSLVGLCVERSLEMMVGILGILQAGGAYVPLDPDLPDDRLAYMLQDSQATIILTQEKLQDRLSDLTTKDAQLIALDRQWSEISDCAADLKVRQVELQQEVKAHHLAYVIYTSGSTGQPKGVMVEHGMIIDYAYSVYQQTELAQCETFASLSTFSADLGNTTLFVPLIFNKTIHLFSNYYVRDPVRLKQSLDNDPVDCMKITPSHFEMFKLSDTEIVAPTKVLIFAGEPLTKRIVDTINTLKSGCKVFNNYGPTETTVAKLSTSELISKNISNINLGKPLNNAQIYILDPYNQPQPVGVPGELHIAGNGVARGYLNRVELTKEKFVSNPFNPGTRMYKSGDLARWLSDGNIEFLGRIDTQVKIRGVRIELGEIEAQLNQHPVIKDSAVIAQGEEPSKQLIAFYVADGRSDDEFDLRSFLGQSLPDNMLPAAFVSLESIPLTPNGKVDRRALERIEVSLESSQAYLAPRNATEKQLVAIWAEVLRLEPETIGVNDNFFELGGHSLLATQLISRVRSQFAIDLPLKALFEHGTISGFAALVVKADTNNIPPIVPVKRTDDEGWLIESFALSYAQERLWFIDQLEPNSAGYNIPAAVTISGEINADHLDQAFNLIIARHENLRTIFPSEDGQAQQVILDSLEFTLDRIDLSHHKSSQTSHEKARQLCQTEAATPFDLARGPLTRGKLIKLTDQEHILMLTMHHIISDAWSTGVMIREFGVIMDCLQQDQSPNKSPDLPPLSIQYLDYSVWQRKLLGEGGLLEKQLGYWQEKLAGVPESLNLATDYPRPSVQSFAGASHSFRLDVELAGQLKKLAEQRGCTLFMTLLAAFKVLLYRYTGEEDICIGSPIANRHYGETESLIGMFINTLALRSQLETDASFISLLAQIKATCLDAYEHQDTPFEKIVDLVQPGRNMAISPLFQIMFNLQNAPAESTGQNIQAYSLGGDSSKFDLTLTLTESSGRLEASITYKTALFKSETIERMAQHFKALCQAIVIAPMAHISTLEFISEAEKQQLLTDFNDTQADYPKDKCIHQQFIEQAETNPDQIALVYNDESLSYQQLYDKSHALALYLQSLGIMPDSLVGLCVGRSNEMMVGLLGVLQAGGAYVPLDPDLPEDRLAYMLEDSQAAIVLTVDALKDKLSALVQPNTKIIVLDHQDDFAPGFTNEVKRKELNHEVKPDHLAYVIYTSGSTGQPKGVMVEHRMVVDYCYSVFKKMDLHQCETFAAVSTFSADLGNIALFVPILFSKTLHLFSNEYVNHPIRLKNYFDDHPIDCMKITPSHFEMFKLSDSEIVASSKVLIFAGEPLTKKMVETVNTLKPGCKVFNNYGPTETTISKLSTSELVGAEIATICLGKPLNNAQVYILDANHQPQPIGVPGELHIAGDGVARGYFNRPELTEEKFIPNLFSPGTRMYKSGDLARWLGDGNIEYLGRIDTQVKIRGFRIELGEIEAQLNQHPKIKDSVVIAQGKESHKKLVAYYVTGETKQDHIVDLDSQGLRDDLQQTLPDYMLPAAFVSLEAIPLTPNGKVNRRALERMDVSLESSQAYLAPRNEMEQQLVAIWAELLGLEPEKIGVNDNFFELGGHSLLATQLISRVRSKFAIDLPLKVLFEHGSISGFAALVVKAETSKVPPILPVKRTDEEGQLIGSFPLSYAQERLWFIDQLEPDSAGYNIPAAVTISGELNADYLDQAFNLIIARHENLRTIFPCEEGEAQQVVLDHLDFKLERIDLSHDKSNKTRHKKARQLCQSEAATPFDLARGPLIRGKLIKLTEQEHILTLTMHHIISDGWSTGVMIREFGVIIDNLRQGQDPDLPALPIQYLDYSVWQRNLLEEGGLLEEQLGYWQEKLSGVPESLNLATDYPRPSVQSFSGANQVFRFDAQLTDQLKSLAEQQGSTLFMILLAAFKVLLYRYSGEEDICLGSPIANRQYGETENLIGMFVNTLALRSQLEADASFISLLAQVKTTCLDAYEHQDTPFEKIVDLVQPGRSMAVTPLFQIMIALQNAPEESTEQHIQAYSLGGGNSKFDLTIACAEAEEGIGGTIEYKTALYSPQTIERMAEHFEALCQAIVTNPMGNISALEFIGEVEKQQLLTDFNTTQADYPKDKCIHQLFIEQVAINPDQTAVVYQDESLSYQQLYDRSYALALYLQSLGVEPDSLVGLCVERSLEMIVGILGILQAGAAYVPLDHEYPDARLSYMLEDSQVAIVLTQEKLKEKLSSLALKGTTLITLDQQGAEIRECVNELKSRHVPLLQEVTPNHLAYIIYTSGSTGQPKGVLVEHQGVVNTVNWFTENFNVSKKSKLIQLTDYTFDPSVEDIFGSLSTGATLHIPTTDLLLDESNLVHYINEKEISGLNFVPGVLKGLLCDYDKLESIEFVISGGEKLDESVKNAILEKGYNLYNNYGPTETTIDVLSTKCTEHPVVIGSPVANTQIYVLDPHNNPVPIGVPGELHIAGDGLARGYLNRPELTEEKFLTNPFNPGTRMYKSGDLARWLGDGNIEYLGRIDTQVKIRGFRIELGEIESQLNQYPEIKDSVVIAQEQEGNKQLIAYYVAEGTKEEQVVNLANEDLRAGLQQTLPEYMLPAAFVSLEAIPLTSNGKVDRRALERMDVSLESSQAYLAPCNATEKQLVAIWAEVLNLEPEKIGVNDNFFELGGHSLLAVRLMAKINAQFKRSLPLAILFSASSTAALAQLIAHEDDNTFDVLVPIQTKGDKSAIFAVPGAGGNVLSFQPLSHALGSNQPFYGLQAVGLDGKTPPLDSVEKTAMANITALQSIQATGPYRIIGHSYGGAVAYEMARILVAQDEKIASLILLDSFAPSVIQKRDTSDETSTLLDVCISLANLYGINLNLDRKSLQKVPKDKRSEYISSIFNRQGIDVNTEQFTTFYNVFEANRLCYLEYKPSIFSHKISVSLFRAIESQHDKGTFNDYGWNELLVNPIQIYDVKANHFSMLDKNHIQQIIKKISSQDIS